ncbi:hypothetical protein MHBO_000743 [Bonamia ostreae]
MLATAVGARTCWGALLKGLSADHAKTPLERKLQKLVKIIGIVGAVLSVLIFVFKFVYWVVENYPNNTYTDNLEEPLEYFLVSISLLVVAIPEGLPLAVTITLAFSMKKMFRDNNFVRVLSACETMGNATTICSDKTGTLTQNTMTVVEAWPEVFEPSVDGPWPVFREPRPSSDFCDALLEGIALNTKAFEIERTKWKRSDRPEYAGGNKTECAVFSWGHCLGAENEVIRQRTPIEKAYPFTSATKRSSVLVRHNNAYRMHMKGAAEKILNDFCTKILTPEGEIASIDEKKRMQIEEEINSKVSRGLRCICLAFRDFDSSTILNSYDQIVDPPLVDFVFVAIIALKDPLRPDVLDSVQRCQQSGIVVRMVTGDHPKTAEFIAAECGIRPTEREDLLVMTGEEFRVMDETACNKKLPKLRVLARSTPQDKERLVKWYMKNNDTVSVTGDGANDALALKEADVGLSMGIQGTDVAKEASDIIILDDSFASIVETVKWGRCVYDNIRKFVQFQITINTVAVLVSFIGAFVNYNDITDFPLPFNPVQLLWMNLLMDTGAAVAYSTESPTKNLLKRKPYKKNSMLINPTMWKHIIGQSVIQIILLLIFVLPTKNPIGFAIFGISSQNKNDYLLLKTCVFNTFVWFQIFNSINTRRVNDELNIFENIFSNLFFPLVFGFFAVMQIILITFGGSVVSLTKLDLAQWGKCIAFGFVSMPLGLVLRSIPFKREYGFISSDGDLNLARENKKSIYTKSIKRKLTV